MKQDLDRLMEERGLDALVVSGKLNGNPPLFYVTGGAKIIAGHLMKKRGHDPVLVSSPIDREVAAATGLRVVTTARYEYLDILGRAADPLAALVELYRRAFADLEIGGRVAFYGMAGQGAAWKLLNSLQAQLGIEVYGEFGKTLVDEARATKDAGEAARIREAGRRTAAIMGQTVEFLQSHAVKNGALVQADGTPLTIGRVHRQIDRFLAEQELDVPEGVIFGIGRDAGVPHNKGTASDLLRLGRSIIFDFGTREAGGGYYFDMTRTFCLGYAPPEVEKAYRDVYDCQQTLIGAYEAGQETRKYMQMACDFFEGRGHPTVATDGRTQSGFMHGLGHGIGLAVHEEPFFSLAPSELTVLQPGHIFTCEPGVYYPDRGYGVRLEDVIYIGPNDRVENLTEFPKELVIPV